MLLHLSTGDIIANLVKMRTAVFPHHLNHAHRFKRITNSRSQSGVAANDFGKLFVGEWLRQIGWQDGQIIGLAVEGVAVHYLQQPLIVEALAAASPASLPIVAPHLFLVRQQHGKGEVGVGQQVGNAGEFVEDVEHLTPLGGFAAADGFANGRFFHNPLALRDGVVEVDGVIIQQPRQLAFHGIQMAGLDFNQLLAAHNVNDKPPQFDLKLVGRLRQPRFEFGVEGFFGKGSD